MDVLTQNILSSSKNLNSLLASELPRKVLEIDVSADSTSQFILLIRLVRSLDQYVNKSRDLKYIGLVGHYSSGKSSTINSILRLKGTKDERDADLNPTDKAITLITHSANSSNLILMSKEGSAVPIRTSFVDSEILDEVVISDTPGSGDPDIVNELIQDFLPICDWVFYFITATNPLDQADIPLLSQKASKLPFIPISFVITRTDEFRNDKLLPLSDSNLNQAKKDAFLGKLRSRLQHLINLDELDIDRFIFIDNESQYNIDKLRNEFIGNSTSIDEQSLVEMHIHKVEYYKSGLNLIFDFFSQRIQTKIQQCNGFLTTAKENIIHFDKDVQINGEKMHSLWSKNELQFAETFDQEKREINEINENPHIQSIHLEKNCFEARKILNTLCDQQVTGHTGKLIGDLNIYIKQKLRDTKRNIEENIKFADVNVADISHLFLPRLDFDSFNTSLEIDYAKFNEPIDFIHQKLISALTDTKNTIRYKINQVRSNIEKELLISKLTVLYDSGGDLINENFDNYFRVIEMYQSAVLTKNTKDTIEKLRIGGTLDTLDRKFPESFITKMKQKAFSDVYTDYNPSIVELRQKGGAINSRASELRHELEKISVAKNDYETKLVREGIEVSLMINEIAHKKELAINLAYQERLSKVKAQHEELYRNYKREIEEAQRKRKRLMIIVALSVLAFSLVFTLVYKYSDYASPTTTVGEILLGCISTIIMEVVGLGIIYLKSNIKGLKKKKLSGFESISKISILHAFNESFWEELNKSVEEKVEVNSPFLRKRISDKIDPLVSELIQRNQAVLNDLLMVFSKVKNLLSEHKENLHSFYKKFSIVFSQSKENADKISMITKEIREQSIKPSFELLQETSAELINVNQKIQDLKRF